MEDLTVLAAHRRSIERLIPLLEAIRSVAEIAWRRADQASTPLLAYERRLTALLRRVASSLGPDDWRRLTATGAPGGPVGLLLVTSERGLCGGFNHRLVAGGLRLSRRLSAQGEQVRLLCIGRRGTQILDALHEPVLRSWSMPSVGMPAYPDVEQVAISLLDLVGGGAIGRLIAVHNAPGGRFEFGQQQRELLPPRIVLSMTAASPEPGQHRRMRIKPAGDAGELVTHLLTEHLLVALYRVVFESITSEQLARIQAMRLAVENARGILDRLILDYTVASRQAMTSALLEITTGYQLAQGAADRGQRGGHRE